MAENEVLDVGNRRHYRRWREALADPNLSPAEVAEPLVQECLLRLKNNLRRKPLLTVLKACGSDRQALQDAVANLKDRALAKFVERGYCITQSTNPLIVGQKIAELLIDKLVDKANRYVLKQGKTRKLLNCSCGIPMRYSAPSVPHSRITTDQRRFRRSKALLWKAR